MSPWISILAPSIEPPTPHLLFSSAGEFFEFRRRQWNTGDERNGFAIAALGLSLESNDAITIRLNGLALACFHRVSAIRTELSEIS